MLEGGGGHRFMKSFTACVGVVTMPSLNESMNELKMSSCHKTSLSVPRDVCHQLHRGNRPEAQIPSCKEVKEGKRKVGEFNAIYSRFMSNPSPVYYHFNHVKGPRVGSCRRISSSAM